MADPILQLIRGDTSAQMQGCPGPSKFMKGPFIANWVCGARFALLRHALPAVQTSAQRDSFELREKMPFRLSLLPFLVVKTSLLLGWSVRCSLRALTNLSSIGTSRVSSVLIENPKSRFGCTTYIDDSGSSPGIDWGANRKSLQHADLTLAAACDEEKHIPHFLLLATSCEELLEFLP